jgi:hypothetical protein
MQRNQSVNKLSITKQHDFNAVTPLQNHFRGPVFFIFEDPSLLACDVVSRGEHGTKEPLTQCHIPEDTAVRPPSLALFILINESTGSNNP